MRRAGQLVTALMDLLDAGQFGDQAPALAREYADVCRAASERLQQARALLRKGEVSEALRIVRRKPELLAYCRILDFAAVEYWQDVASRRGWPVAPRMDSAALAEVAAALQSAGAREPLLAEYRDAALRHDDAACAGVLRQLVALDPTQLSWQADLRRFEQKRLGQLAGEVREAGERQDAARLRELDAELSGSWLTPIPVPVRRALDGYLRAGREREARARARGMLAVLEAQRAANDVAAAKACLKDWKAVARDGGYRPSDGEEAQAAAVAAWVQATEQQQSRQRAVELQIAELRLALDAPDLDRDVEPLWRTLQALRVPLPPDLATRVREVQRKRERGRTVRRMRRIAGWGVVAIAVGAGVAVASWQAGLRSARDKLATSLRVAFERNEGPAFLEAVRRAEAGGGVYGQRLAAMPEVKVWLDRRAEMETRQAGRAAALAGAWTALDGVRAGGFEADLATVSNLLVTARANRQVAADDSRLAAFTNAWHTSRRQALAAVLGEVRTALPEAAVAADWPPQQLQTAVDTVQALLVKARQITPAPPDLVVQLEEAATQAGGLKQQADARRERLAGLGAAAALRDYLALLETYAAANPQDPGVAASRARVAQRAVYESLSAVSPAGTYDRPSARLHFMTIVTDTFYPNVPKENPFWSPLVADLARLDKLLAPKWPAVQKRLAGLLEDRFLAALWEREGTNGTAFYVDLQGAGAEPAGLAPGATCPAYVPAERDSAPVFTPRALTAEDLRTLRPMAHCRFVRGLAAEAASLHASDVDDLLLRRLLAILKEDGLVGDGLRLKLVRFLAEQFVTLELRNPLSPFLADAGRRLAREDERAEAAWLCRLNQRTVQADQAAQALLGELFADTTLIRKYRLERWLHATAHGRGVRYAGAVDVFGRAPEAVRGDPAEVWVVRFDEKVPRVLVAGVRGAEGRYEWQTPLEPAEPLFAPGGRATTEAVLEAALRESGLDSAALRACVWPGAWPANRRGGT